MKLALVIGHSSSSKGAVAVDGVQEWDWTRPLAGQIERLAPFDVRTFYRTPNQGYTRPIKRVAREINAWGADAVIALHFNAFPEPPGVESVNGTMALYWPGSTKGRALAAKVSRAVSIAQGTRDRGAREQASSWGGARLHILADTLAPAIILETHYGDDPEDHRKATSARDSGATAKMIIRSFP